VPPARNLLLAGALIAIAVTDVVSSPAAESLGPIYSIGRTSPYLLRIDPHDGACIDSIRITLPGQFPTQGNGLAAHPQTGELWAVLRLIAVEGRELVTLDPWSGRATSVGNLGTDVSALAFDHDGVLYGLTGQSGDPTASLCRVDPTNAEMDSVAALVSGRGHALAYNPDEEFFMHATGEQQLELVDLYSFSVMSLPVSGYSWSSPKALTYAGDDRYYFAAEGSLFLVLDGSGVCDSVGVTRPTKGLALGQWTVDAPPGPLRETVLRAWPNPLRGGTLRIELTGTEPASGPLRIFDVHGRLVRELGPAAPDGTVSWSGRDGAGRPVPAGVYFLGGRTIVVLR
jgi:hypothetical protein